MILPDIDSRIIAQYGKEADAARNILSEFSSKPGASPRVIRCILYLAAGDIRKLREYRETAEQDPRDVIYWAENRKDGERLRDFNEPFPK